MAENGRRELDAASRRIGPYTLPLSVQLSGTTSKPIRQEDHQCWRDRRPWSCSAAASSPSSARRPRSGSFEHENPVQISLAVGTWGEEGTRACVRKPADVD